MPATLQPAEAMPSATTALETVACAYAGRGTSPDSSASTTGWNRSSSWPKVCTRRSRFARSRLPGLPQRRSGRHLSSATSRSRFLSQPGGDRCRQGRPVRWWYCTARATPTPRRRATGYAPSAKNPSLATHEAGIAVVFAGGAPSAAAKTASGIPAWLRNRSAREKDVSKPESKREPHGKEWPMTAWTCGSCTSTNVSTGAEVFISARMSGS